MQFGPWIISVLALILSICSYRRSGQFRKNDIKLQAFNNRVASPIETALSDLEVTAGDLRSFRRSSRGLSAQKTELSTLGKKVAEKYEKLVGTLERADSNQQTNGNDWGQIAEPHYDKFLFAINMATAKGTAIDGLRNGIEAALIAISSISKVVHDRISQEIQFHVNQNLHICTLKA